MLFKAGILYMIYTTIALFMHYIIGQNHKNIADYYLDIVSMVINVIQIKQ